jgi:Rieske Fe-S protein
LVFYSKKIRKYNNFKGVLMKSSKDSCLSRRTFIGQSLKGMGVLAIGTYTVASLSGCSEDESNPTGPSGTTLTVDLSLAENQTLQIVGGTLALGSNDLDSQGILLYRSDSDTVLAYSRNCTHQNCTIGAFTSGVSTCACHGSKFNLDGDVVQGPASAPLRSFQTTLDGDTLTIST